jgi:hypothetical protein
MSGTLVAAGVLQAVQALLWLATGLLIGFGGTDVPGDPASVVLVIAAATSIAVGVFVLALACGIIGDSDVCRAASIVVQCVSTVLVVIACAESIGRGRSLLVRLAPHTGPVFVVRPGVLVVALGLAGTVLTLLMCGRSTGTRR